MKKIKNPWIGIEGYNCVGCCPDNEIGLKMEFYEDSDEIVSFWDPTDNYQSWIDTLHGGIQSLIIDEICGWVLFRKLQTTGVTSRLEVKYLKPVTIKNNKLTIRARLAKHARNVAYIDAEIYNQEGVLCCKGTAIYFCAPREKAQETGLYECVLEEE